MLVFVPGIMGSELYRREPDGRRRPVWSGSTAVLLHALAREPLQLTGDLEPGAIIRSVGIADVYGVFLDTMADWGLEFLPFP